AGGRPGGPRGGPRAPAAAPAARARGPAVPAGDPKGTLPGRDLLEETVAAVPLYAETLAPRVDFGWSELRSLRDGRYKYVKAPRPELYDVEADPAETRDL